MNEKNERVGVMLLYDRYTTTAGNGLLNECLVMIASYGETDGGNSAFPESIPRGSHDCITKVI